MPTLSHGRLDEPYLGRAVSVSFGLFDRTEVPLHVHPDHDQYTLFPEPNNIIIRWVDGEGKVHEEKLEGRHLWAIPRGFKHGLTWPGKACWINLYAERGAEGGTLAPKIERPTVYDLTHFEIRDPQIRQSVRSFLRLCYRRRRERPLYVEALATVTTIHIAESEYRPNRRPDLRRTGLSELQVEQILDFIDKHLAEKLRLSHLCGHLKLSRTHFLRLFKRSLYYTPFDYVMRCRVAKAARRLVTSKDKEIVIAQGCGFADAGHMLRQFRRILGKNPSEVRAEGKSP